MRSDSEEIVRLERELRKSRDEIAALKEIINILTSPPKEGDMSYTLIAK